MNAKIPEMFLIFSNYNSQIWFNEFKSKPTAKSNFHETFTSFGLPRNVEMWH